MSRVIVIASGKGGVGKTTTAINLAAAINSFDEEVIIVDANLTTPNVGLHFGAPIVPVSLNHVLSGKADIADAIYEHESGTKIIPSSLSVKELRKINHDKLKSVAKQLKGISDYVIFDCSAGLGKEAISAIEAADDVIIVTNPEMPSVTDALKTIRVSEDLGKSVIGAIVTRARKTRGAMTIKSIKEMLEVPVLGIVPEDNNMQEALALKNAIFFTHPNSKASKSYRKIAAKLVGKSLIEEEPEGFFQRILYSFGLR